MAKAKKDKVVIFEITNNTGGGVVFQTDRERVFVPQIGLQADASLYSLGVQAVDEKGWEVIRKNGRVTFRN